MQNQGSGSRMIGLARNFQKNLYPRRSYTLMLGILMSSTLLLTGCGAGKRFNKSANFFYKMSQKVGKDYNSGQIIDEATLNSIRVGSSREQVLMVLGSPSLTQHSQGDVFYYVSEKLHQQFAFLKAKPVERTILVLYFDKNGFVSLVNRYNLKDGKTFQGTDSTTPTAIKDAAIIKQILKSSTLSPIETTNIPLP